MFRIKCIQMKIMRIIWNKYCNNSKGFFTSSFIMLRLHYQQFVCIINSVHVIFIYFILGSLQLALSQLLNDS